MTIYISVDDGDSLQHYGVLGMKWGVRNAETKAKYAAAKRNKPTLRQKFQAKRYEINENGWMSPQGKKQLRADRSLQDAIFKKRNVRLSDKEYAKAEEKYLKNNNTQIWKNLYKQERLEFDFDDYNIYLKYVNSNLKAGEKELELAVNRIGDLQIREKDPQLSSSSKNGYETVQSMSDVMKIVKIQDIKKY